MSRSTGKAAVLPGSGGEPLPPTCPATLATKGLALIAVVAVETLESVGVLNWLMMLIEEGIGGFGDKTKEGEAKDEDAAQFEIAEESKTGDHTLKSTKHTGGGNTEFAA